MVDIRGGLILVRENATGNVNSINTAFSTQKRYVSSTLRVELNGQKLVKDDDFTETSDTTFTMTDAPIHDLSYTDKLVVEYQQK